MPYEYYCTNCGSKLAQEEKKDINGSIEAHGVLFDMFPLISDKEFSVLKWRCTLEELEALTINRPENQMVRPGKVDEKYYPVEISYGQFLSYFKNANNMNDSRIEGLTINDFEDYLNKETGFADISLADDAPKNDDLIISDLLSNEDEDEDDFIPGLAFEERIEAKNDEKAISENDNKIDKNSHLEFVEDVLYSMTKTNDSAERNEAAKEMLVSELSEIISAFKLGNGFLKIYLRNSYDRDDEDNRFLCGYDYYLKGYSRVSKRRICPICGRTIFSRAGEAKHRTVTFIGKPNSGKTSTILALTHFARFYNPALSGKIWNDSNVSEKFDGITIFDANEGSYSSRLEKDLKIYEAGYAADKTHSEKRGDAYSSTFLVVTSTNKKTLLTIYDLPGELCGGKRGMDNEVKAELIKNEFPVAIRCDEYVLCFDTTDTNRDPNAILRVCGWGSQIQEMRRVAMKTDHYAPMMLLFTKSSELENEQPKISDDNYERTLQQFEKSYMFTKEDAQINAMPQNINRAMYNTVWTKMEGGNFSKAYYASLRCSPYGYPAVEPPEAIDIEALLEDDNNQLPKPKPVNVDKLMCWLLCAAGCTPVRGEFKYDITSDSNFTLGEDYYLIRTQYREEPPLVNDNDYEALARCILFRNPGKCDVALIESHNDKWVRLANIGKIKMGFLKNL